MKTLVKGSSNVGVSSALLFQEEKMERKRPTSSFVIQQQMTLSQEIIPAVPGEYYSYASVFTKERPLYVLMKCKARKARMIWETANLGSEVNALFQLEEGNPQILSIKAANALGLLEEVKSKGTFGDTWFAPTKLTIKQFMDLRESRNGKGLVKECRKLLTDRQVVTDLHEGLVVAFMTDGGKYGMFLVEEITSSLIQIEACHVLL